METMKAVRMHSYGVPEVLVVEEVPRPEAAAGELLIRVCAAGVNPLDWKVRSGQAHGGVSHRLPLIPGWDFSGIVDQVGADVFQFKKGDQVFGMLDFSRQGAYAEYVVARPGEMAPKPLSLAHVQAAGAPMAALTAWQALFEVAQLSSGQTVLIHGAAGGVGHIAVQLARWRGARVIGTASARNLPFLSELGVTQAIDYQKVPFEEVAGPVDVVLDTIGGETQERSLRLLKNTGVLVTTVGLVPKEKGGEAGVKRVAVAVHPDAFLLARVAALIDTGGIRPVVGSVFQLAEAAKAQELSQTGHARGKIVLKVHGC